MADAVVTAAIDPGWLRNRSFDLTLIRSVALIALLSGLIVVWNPDLFVFVLMADVWLLGYHHVISTMTRLSFDRHSLRQHRFLVFYLPPIVFAGTFLLAWQVGFWAIASLYLYWQWFHYTRQSWGVSQAYRRKAGDLVDDGEWFAKLSFYLLPLYGILYRSWQAPEEFLFLEVRVVPVPGLLVDAVGAAAMIMVAMWATRRYTAWRRGRLARAHTYYMLTHFAIFLVGYRLIDDITHGWLVINVWHNAQYILFVWLFNANRFKNGVEPKARFLSTISQNENRWKYFGVCLAISTTLYVALLLAAGGTTLAGLPLVLLVYQAINFHHYIVDSIIWKMRKKPLRENLGLEKT